MPFGKHKGKLLDAVPVDYLIWCLNECSGMDRQLRRAMEREVERRTDADERPQRPAGPPPAPPGVWSAVITAWHRRLVLRHHPDRGGDVKVMKALNAVVDELRQLVGV
jgi:hypothetical protein